jgi:hypothetical protein
MFRLSLFSDLDSSTVSHFDKEDDLAMPFPCPSEWNPHKVQVNKVTGGGVLTKKLGESACHVNDGLTFGN